MPLSTLAYPSITEIQVHLTLHKFIPPSHQLYNTLGGWNGMEKKKKFLPFPCMGVLMERMERPFSC